MSSILGQCAECCECPTPQISGTGRFININKMGLEPFGGQEAYPAEPKFYSRISQSGTQVDDYNPTFDKVISTTVSGSGVVSRTQAIITSYFGRDVSSSLQYEQSCSGPDCGPGYPLTVPWPFGPGTPYEGYNVLNFYFQNSVGSGPAGSTSWVSGSYTFTLSDEYTTADLIAYGESLLATLPFSGTIGSAARNLSYQGTVFSLSEFKYQFKFQVPKVGRGNKYIIKWIERFSPEGGGAPTDTVKTFTWNGVVPVGYDVTDQTTWPTSDEYTLAAPATDGVSAVACVTSTCSGTAPSDPCNP